MQGEHAKILERLDRVQEFLDENKDVLADVIPPTAVAHFVACRERMHEHVIVQGASARSFRVHAGTKREIRDRLVAQMRRIHLVARARRMTAPDLVNVTKAPRPRSFIAHVAAASGLADAARPFQQAFVEGGLPRDFIEQLEATADALRSAIATKGQSNAHLVAATEGQRREASNARLELEIIASYIRDRLLAPTLVSRWEAVSGVAPVRAPALANPADVRSIAGAPTLRALPASTQVDPPPAPPAEDADEQPPAEDGDDQPPALPTAARNPWFRRLASALGGGVTEKAS